jgi:Protein of unknown function, DUF547
VIAARSNLDAWSHVLRQVSCVMLGLMSMVSVATLVPAVGKAQEALSVATWESLWSKVLARRVDDDGRIDFAGLNADHADLDRVVAFIAAIDPVLRPERFPTQEAKVAFYINAYNALAMHGVVQAGVPASLGGLAKLGFFYLRTFAVGGRSISLHDLEDDVIRPMGEERVHFALNCMVVSCPRLPRKAFTAETLERQLDAAARLFVREDRNIRLDPAVRAVGLSSIFNFYTDDFLAHAPTLSAYVNRYRLEPIPGDLQVRFLDYDWTVNARDRTGER